ncbi:MAG: bacteriophage holin [Candidatus Zixiibacteriota bacterium]
MRLNVKALALTSGILWGLSVFVVTWWVLVFEGATGDITWLGHIYRGYSISYVGSFIGLLWGLFDGLIGGAIFGWLYNFIAGRGTGRTAST